MKKLIMDIVPARPVGERRPALSRQIPRQQSKPVSAGFRYPLNDIRHSRPLTQQVVSPKTTPRRSRKLGSGLVYILLLVAGVALGLSSYNQQIGQIVLALYAVAALIFKIKSQYTFAAALFTLVLVPLLLVIHKEGLANNYAVYSYLLLAVGVLSAVLELFRENKGMNTK